MDSLATIQPGRLEGLNINGIHTFLGIPYAKPPVGPLRWHAPEPPERWEGVRPAKQFGPIAIQTTGACFTLRETRQSEDSLSLNTVLVIHSTLLWPTIGLMSICSMVRALARRTWCSTAC